MQTQALDERLIASVAQIAGASRARFGTGFVIHREGDHALILTCAHVLDDVGGPAGLAVDGLPAEVVAAGSAQAIDLAVLRVAGLAGDPLPLLAADAALGEAEELRIVGFQSFGTGLQLLHPLAAQLGDLAVIGQAQRGARARAWWLKVTGERGLEPGFSGAPALSLASRQILGVVSMRQGASAGLAIAISELRKVWSACPPELFARPGLPLAAPPAAPPAPLTPGAEETAADLLARLRAALPPELQSHLDDLAAAVLPSASAALAAGRDRASVPISAAGAAALEALAGAELRSERATIAFGRDSQFGDISLRDVAGRDLVNINVFLPEGEQVASWPPPPPPPLARPVAVFVGAGLPDDEPALALRRQLALRGLCGWPDEQSGQPAGAALAEGLAGSAAALLYLSHERRDDDSLTAEAVALRRRRAQARPLPTRVLLDGPPPAAAAQLDLALERVGDGVERYAPDKAARLAGRTLRAALAAHASQLLADGEVEVGLFTFPPTGAGAGAALLLDWRPLFAPFPSEEQWRAELLPALEDLREALGAAGVRRVRLHPQARNSAALAFGYVFRRETGVQLVIPQRVGEWVTGGAEVTQACEELVTPVAEGGRDLTVELPITQARPPEDVERWMGEKAPALHTRVRLTRRASGDIGPDEARAIAAQVRAAILAHKRVGGVTHLIGALPAGLAALIGWSLNACGPVQTYELRDDLLSPACRVG